jgi:polar amino acid transport system substrate-binding protein
MASSVTQTARFSRRSLLRGGLMLGPMAALPGVLGSCSALGLGDTLGDIQDAGVVRAGYADERPFAYEQNGELTGAVVAVHRAVFDSLGNVDVEGVLVPFRNLIGGLNDGSFDVVMAGMFVTEDRCDLAAFADPTYCSRSALLVRRGNPKDLSDYASVAANGATLGVLGGAVEEGYATESGVSDDAIVHVGDQDEGLAKVASGQIDAFTLTSISLRTLLASAGPEETPTSPGQAPDEHIADRVELLEPFEPVVDGEPQRGCGAAVFRQTDEDLLAAYNEELAALIEEGRLLALMEPFGFTEGDLPDPDVTADELCETEGVSGSGVDPGPR